MQFPQININGSDKNELAMQYSKAARAVLDAAHAMNGLVHGRDYQTLSPVQFENAQEEMLFRVLAMKKVATELLDIANHCIDS